GAAEENDSLHENTVDVTKSSTISRAPEEHKIKTLTTPPLQKPISADNITIDDRAKYAESTRLPGYEPSQIDRETLQESFPIHEHNPEDYLHYKDYKKKDFQKDDYLDVDRFTKRIQQSGQRAKYEDPKTVHYIEIDTSVNSGARPQGGSYYKLYDNITKKRIATFTKEGKFLRK
ncbi:MAG: hypothetical protein P8P83_00050, partial [Rickettsiaceae bacterium]|nr:hypothetical protein [Rickettsiaceae bacterium]